MKPERRRDTCVPNPGSHPVILFDGVCNLCESSTQFVIKRDRDAVFRFAALQSQPAGSLLRQFDYDQNVLDSVLLIADGTLYSKSRAVLQIARRLDGAWPVLYYLFAWLPRFFADSIYDFVGRRRYQWYGRKQACWLPNRRTAGRFLQEVNSLPK